MADRRRQAVRTPRREKLWAVTNSFTTIPTVTPTVFLEPLDTTFVKMGITTLAGLTFIRAFGRLTLIYLADAATPNWSWVRIGLIWVREEVVNAGDGDAQLPELLEDGVRQAEWIQQWEIGGIEQNQNIGTFAPLDGARHGYGTVEFDVTQMRKQPTVNHRLCLIADTTGGYETGTVGVHIQMSCMVALA